MKLNYYGAECWWECGAVTEHDIAVGTKKINEMGEEDAVLEVIKNVTDDCPISFIYEEVNRND